jgi:pyruvate,water dikinase
MHPAPFRRGFQEFARYYGMLFDGREVRYVNGFSYGTLRPVPDDDLAERFRRAEEVFQGKLWREQLREWDEISKPRSIQIHRELQSVDPDALTDAELCAYLTRCRDHHAEMIYQHMRFTGAAMIPLGDLLVHARNWTGAPPSELLGMMRGAAPVSAGASGELAELIAALRADPGALELLGSDADPALVLAQLRSLDSDAGRAVSAYLDLVGCRLLDGFDISGRYALELPDALVRAIRASLEGSDEDESAADAEVKITAVRARVPEEDRGEFDELLGEARLMYRIRDERGVFSDIWASGIMRRVAIAAGRRLAERGRIHDPEHFVDAGFGEMIALVAGADGPSADELAKRYAWRISHSAKQAPPTLGPPPPPPRKLSGLPPAARRVMRAMGITMQSMSASSTQEHEESVLRGFGASQGMYEGPARRVSGPTEFDRIAKGDVLVTESTTEAFNILLPLLGAIVTDTGGVLSHAAIVAREYGIPAVVGTRDGTDRIRDGARVRVDGDSAEVTVLE